MQNGGGGGKLERVSFGAKNGDCCGESAVITTQGNSLDSPCKAPFLSPKSHREQASLESNFTQSPDFSSTILESCANSKNHKSLRKQIAPDNNLDSRQMQSVRAYACGLKIACCDCALGFLRFAGVNAIYFYIAQGVSSSLLFPILRHFPPLAWWVKLPLAFCINLGLCVVFVWILIALFWAISHLARRLAR